MSLAMNDRKMLKAGAVAPGNVHDPDAALVEGARRRDSEAFKELVSRYGPRIFSTALKITRNRDDAEEVSQDTFTQAFMHIEGFRGDSMFNTWLTRIAINQSLMKLRARRSREVHFDDPTTNEDGSFYAQIADETPGPEQRYSQKELRGILASLMRDLSPALRAVVQLLTVEERSMEETATLLGMSIPAVKSRAHRARKKLREGVKRYFHRVDSPISQTRIQLNGSC